MAHLLAEALGVEHLLFFVRDPEVGISLPAPGLRQTLPAGRAWRDFIAACLENAAHTAMLPYPDASGVLPATGFGSDDGSVLVLLGGSPSDDLRALRLLMPLLAAAFRGELAQKASEGHAAASRGAAQQASLLASSLDASRRKIERALRDAREADRRKDEFLAMLAHELRNPLSPMISALAVLRARSGDDPVRLRNQGILARQIHQMTRLIDDLLDVSRITRGSIRLKFETISLSDVLAAAVESTQDLIKERGHTLHVSLPEESVLVNGDSARLIQVFANLLNNAAKYTERGGAVWLSASETNGQAIVKVRDNGIGIPEEMIGHVFDLFVQAHPTLDRSRGGLGLGLTLVHRLVKMHHGSIEVTSGGSGQGSEFIVQLPAVSQQVEPAPPVPGPEHHAPDDRRDSPCRVLVVDDNKDATDALTDLLDLWGHTVAVAHDGARALVLAREFQPDVVLLDIGLPGKDGYEVARHLREEMKSDLPLIVAVTGYGQQADIERSRQAGFDHHVTKPLDPDVIRNFLQCRAYSARGLAL